MQETFATILNVLKLPAKILLGITISCIAIWFIDWLGWISLDDFEPWVRTLVVTVGIISGCVFFTSVLWDLVIYIRAWLKHKETVQGHLKHLSYGELRLVAEAVKRGTPTLYTNQYIEEDHRSLTPLIDKGLLIRHAVNSFSFKPFVWKKIMANKQSFIDRGRVEEVEIGGVAGEILEALEPFGASRTRPKKR